MRTRWVSTECVPEPRHPIIFTRTQLHSYYKIVPSVRQNLRDGLDDVLDRRMSCIDNCHHVRGHDEDVTKLVVGMPDPDFFFSHDTRSGHRPWTSDRWLSPVQPSNVVDISEGHKRRTIA